MRTLLSEIATVFLIAVVLQSLNYFMPLNTSDEALTPSKIYTKDVAKELSPSIHYPININYATKAELMSLSGIGEKTADKIIQYRKRHGEFKYTSDIMKVSGIGSAKYDKIVGNIFVQDMNMGDFLEK